MLRTEPARDAQPPIQALPPAWPEPPGCPGDVQNVQNIHRTVGAAPDHYAQGKALGMTDDEARAYAARTEVAQQQLMNQMLAAIATIPPPPC
ncbi:MAG: hypothetical protein LC799_00775 [Actinobacteria bacterium]|nr:hypothetical protein [Actinomycetota bacterium]